MGGAEREANHGSEANANSCRDLSAEAFDEVENDDVFADGGHYSNPQYEQPQGNRNAAEQEADPYVVALLLHQYGKRADCISDVVGPMRQANKKSTGNHHNSEHFQSQLALLHKVEACPLI